MQFLLSFLHLEIIRIIEGHNWVYWPIRMFLGAEYLPVKCTNSDRIMILLRVFADGCLDTSKKCSLRGRRSKGKGKGNL